MELNCKRVNDEGLTLIEVFLVIALVLILAAFLLPASVHSGPSKGGICQSHQKQIFLGLAVWQNDHQGRFPWQVSETNQGVLEIYERGYAAADFRALNEDSIKPSFLICPTDQAKTIATNVSTLRNENLSYFIGFDQNTNAAAEMLTGDRHLQAGNDPIKPGFFTYTKRQYMGWTTELHHGSATQPFGYSLFYDGHTQWIRGTELNDIFQSQDLPTARYAVP